MLKKTSPSSSLMAIDPMLTTQQTNAYTTGLRLCLYRLLIKSKD